MKDMFGHNVVVGDFVVAWQMRDRKIVLDVGVVRNRFSGRAEVWFNDRHGGVCDIRLDNWDCVLVSKDSLPPEWRESLESFRE